MSERKSNKNVVSIELQDKNTTGFIHTNCVMSGKRKKEIGKTHQHTIMEDKRYRPEKQQGEKKPIRGDKSQMKKKPFNPNKRIGEIINKPIDRTGNQLIKGGTGAVNKIADKAKKAGVDKDLVDYGAKKLIKHGSKLVKEGVGHAKRFIHTEGRQLVNQGIQSAKEGISNLGKRARDKFEEIKGRFSKKRKT